MNDQTAEPNHEETSPEGSVTLVQFHLETAGGGRQQVLSFILSNGDVHRFYALSDGVHHSDNRRHHGDCAAALAAELRRPSAIILVRIE